MASWKKVIVSGSDANLTALQVDNLANGVVTGSSNGTLGIVPINGTGSILATTGAFGVIMSGSFSGSFQGTINSASFAQTASFITASRVFGPFGANSVLSSSFSVTSSFALTSSYVTGSSVFGPFGANSILSASFAVSTSRAVSSSYAGVAGQTAATLSFGEGLSSGSFNGSTNITIQVSGAAQLTNNAITKWDNTDNKFVSSSLTDTGTVIFGSSSIQLTGASSNLSGSFSGSFFGDGSNLTGLVSTLRISGSNYAGQQITSGSVALTNQGLTVLGTQNEISVTASNQTIQIGLPDDVTIGNNLTVTGDLFVQGTTTQINTTDLYVEDKFIVLASGSNATTDGGIIIDRGTDSAANIAFGFDAGTDRWGYQSGLTDASNALDTTSANGVSGSFAVYSFTEAAHGNVKPLTGEFVQQGSMYISGSGEIWVYS